MNLAPSDGGHYLGSIYDSMRYLPQWYQALGASSIVFIFYLRRNSFISWLVINLHSSFGTDGIWHPDYQRLLDQMTFNERFCFTLYGVSIAVVIGVVYRTFCQDTYNLGVPATHLFPERKGPAVATLVVLCIVEAYRLRHVISVVLDNNDSLAHMALSGFTSIHQSSFDPRLALSNSHFVIQVELLRSFTVNFLVRRLPPLLAAATFRAVRDIPRRAHVALRWYLFTVASFMVLFEVANMYRTHSSGAPSTWWTVTWSLFYMGLVNFLYGPARRAGTVITASKANAISELVRSMTTCTAAWAIASMIVLMFVVSVHVFELLLVWLLTTLLTFWLPAATDSCSIECMTLLCGAAGFVAYQMKLLKSAADYGRYTLLLVLWWVVVSLLYCGVVNIFRSRYIGIAAVVWMVLWLVAAKPGERVMDSLHERKHSREAQIRPAVAGTLEPGAMAAPRGPEADGVVLLLTNRLRWVAALVCDEPLPEGAWLSDRGPLDGFFYAIHVAMFAIASLTAGLSLLGVLQSASTRASLRERNLVLITAPVLFRKTVRTVVLLVCLAGFAMAVAAFHLIILPYIQTFLPSFVDRGISLAFGCVILGMLMDMKETLNYWILRIVGVANPILPGGDDEEEDAEAERAAQTAACIERSE